MSMDIHAVERIFEIVAERTRGLAGELGEDLVFIEMRIPRANAIHKFTLTHDEVNHTESHDMETVVQLIGSNAYRTTEMANEEVMAERLAEIDSYPIPLSLEIF